MAQQLHHHKIIMIAHQTMNVHLARHCTVYVATAPNQDKLFFHMVYTTQVAAANCISVHTQPQVAKCWTAYICKLLK